VSFLPQIRASTGRTPVEGSVWIGSSFCGSRSEVLRRKTPPISEAHKRGQEIHPDTDESGPLSEHNGSGIGRMESGVRGVQSEEDTVPEKARRFQPSSSGSVWAEKPGKSPEETLVMCLFPRHDGGRSYLRRDIFPFFSQNWSEKESEPPQNSLPLTVTIKDGPRKPSVSRLTIRFLDLLISQVPR